jgi:hypothetical protein
MRRFIWPFITQHYLKTIQVNSTLASYAIAQEVRQQRLRFTTEWLHDRFMVDKVSSVFPWWSPFHHCTLPVITIPWSVQ